MRPDLQHSPASPCSRRFSAAENWSEAWGTSSSVDMEPLPFGVLLPFSYTRGCAQDELGDLSPQNNRRTGHRGSRVRMHGRPGGTGCTTVETRRGQPENDRMRRKEGSISEYTRKPPSMQQRSSFRVGLMRSPKGKGG